MVIGFLLLDLLNFAIENERKKTIVKYIFFEEKSWSGIVSGVESPKICMKTFRGDDQTWWVSSS